MTYTPSVFIYVSYYVYPKSNLANFDQFIEKYSNNYDTQYMHYQHTMLVKFNLE